MMAYNIFHSGLFGISYCGFGGRTLTEEPQEKSSIEKREYTSTMMVQSKFYLGLFGISNYGFGGETRTKEPQEKNPQDRKENTLVW